MRFSQINKNKPDNVYIVIKNGEASAALTQGMPVVMKFNGTDDGLAVEKPSTTSDGQALGCLAGIMAETSLAAGKIGLAQVYGFCQKVNVGRMTRSATDAAWASIPAIALGDVYKVDTVNDVLTRVGSNAASAFLPWCAAGTTIASTTTASTASTIYGVSGTISTVQIQAFLRML